MGTQAAPAASEIAAVGVIGAGQMGSGIAQLAAAAGCGVFLLDSDPAALSRAVASISSSLGRLVAKGQLSQTACDDSVKRIKCVSDVQELRGVDLVIEAIVESEDVKKKLFVQLDKITKPSAILASNTSSISITRLASATSRPSQVIGMHFFNPPPIMKLVEIIRGADTSEEVFSQVKSFSERQEASGYFFCLEDRALLCRDCDVAIHTVNSFVSVHQRFLLTGVQVGLEPADPVPPIADKHVNASGGSVNSQQKHLARKNPTVLSGESSVSIASQNAISGDYSRQISVPNTNTATVNWTMGNNAIRSADPPPKYLSDGSSKPLLSSQTRAALSNEMNRDGDPAYNLPFSGGNGSNSLPDWPVDEFFSNLEYSPNFGFTEQCYSKDDNGKLGSAGGSPQCRLAEGLFGDELLGQVPALDADDPWVVPEIPSPPTASGLCWQGNLYYPVHDNAMFVPKMPSLQSSQDHYTVSSAFKRRRREF